MDVSFGGITNIKIFEKKYSKYGSYLANNSTIKVGDKDYRDIIIRCDLTDDVAGKDFSEFKNVLAKSRPCYQQNCPDKKYPNHIDLYSHSSEVKDDIVDVEHSIFKINDYDIVLDERQALPLFSFMAHLTRKISQMADLTLNQRKTADFVNQKIDKEAREFIDNMY